MRRLIDITSEDIKMGKRGDENTCAIALALQEAYNTLNVSVQRRKQRKKLRKMLNYITLK